MIPTLNTIFSCTGDDHAPSPESLPISRAATSAALSRSATVPCRPALQLGPRFENADGTNALRGGKPPLVSQATDELLRRVAQEDLLEDKLAREEQQKEKALGQLQEDEEGSPQEEQAQLAHGAAEKTAAHVEADSTPDSGTAVLQAEQEAQERKQVEKRKAAVTSFLREHGFSCVSTPKRTLMGRTTYPIHEAARIGSWKMVSLLIQEGVDPKQRDSRGKTAAQIAHWEDDGESSSHASVLIVLGEGRRKPPAEADCPQR